MYQEFETRTSYNYLQKVISVLQEPVCILGGWAVFLQVNKNFQKAQGRPYLGSRDIDLGFHEKVCCEIIFIIANCFSIFLCNGSN